MNEDAPEEVDPEKKAAIQQELKKLEGANKLAGLMKYGKDTVGLEANLIGSADHKAGLRGISLFNPEKQKVNRFKNKSKRRFRRRGKKRDVFADGLASFNARHQRPKPKPGQVVPVGSKNGEEERRDSSYSNSDSRLNMVNQK